MSSSNETNNLQEFLYRNVKKRNWEVVITKCGEQMEGLQMKLTQPDDTVLHMAAYDKEVEVVETLVQLICNSQQKNILYIKNKRGNTPLHVAALMGCAQICNIIGSADEMLVNERNIDGETPLFLAANYGYKEAFYSLYQFCRTKADQVETNCRRNNGDTIIHCALKNEKFDLAFQVLNMNKDAANWVDGEGYNPLQILATKPSAFRSGSHITLWQQIIYHCILVRQIKPEIAPTHFKSCKEKSTEQIISASFPKNYATCLDFLSYCWKGFSIFLGNFKIEKFKRKENQNSGKDDEANNTDLEKDDGEDIENIETHKSNPRSDTQVLLKQPGGRKLGSRLPLSSRFPKNYDTCINFLQFFFSCIMVVLGLGFRSIKKLEEKKEKHTWAVQVLEKLLKLNPPDKYGLSGDTVDPNKTESKETLPYKLDGPSVDVNEDAMERDQKLPQVKDPEKKDRKPDTLMLLAAKNGVVEIVKRIFDHFPLAIRDSNLDKKNAVLLAAEYRQPKVYDFLLKKQKQLETLFRAVDKDGNSAFHLAAQLKTHKTWRITGPALQMQWEVKWYRYVRDSVEPHFFVKYNDKGKLARTIFYETHSDLGKKGGEWLTNTAESCSVVAALIVTVAYASATTIPGGNGDDGTSPFKTETGLFIFALTSLIALCLSTTSVIMFLAILTSRFDEKDFGSKLPWRLFIGMSSLFFSIVAMLVSFCAGHYFLLNYYLQNMAVVIYIATSFPVALLFVIAQLPLYYDLLFAGLSKTPKRSSDAIVLDDPDNEKKENLKNHKGDGNEKSNT